MEDLDLPMPAVDDPQFAQVEQGFRMILLGLGLDMDDPHMRDTPRRAAKAWINELCVGALSEPPQVTMFPVDGPSQMIVLGKIPVLSMCSHHLLPIKGTAVVGYIPGKGELMGLSKLSRIVNYYARRPQVQERLTNQIADFIGKLVVTQRRYYLHGKEQVEYSGGVGVVIHAKHDCMELRGVTHSGGMTTSALRGVFEEAEVRAEFLDLAKKEM